MPSPAAPLTGALHLHSAYSYDGVHRLAELADFARLRGYDFLCLSEHSDALAPEAARRMARECDEVSRESGRLLIPGIEFTCDANLHLIGLGVSELSGETEPAAVCRFIHEQGGVSIVAHPSRYDYRVPEALLGMVDGIEIWNAGYDGRHAPNPRSMELQRRCARARGAGGPFAFSGLDLHRIHRRGVAEIRLDGVACDRLAILAALKRGEFRIRKGLLRLRADGRNPPWARAAAGFLYHLYRTARAIRDRLAAS
jgi:hypothetical protein